MTKVYNRVTEKSKRRALRREMTKAEAKLWSRLRGKQILGYKFRRQFSVGPYMIDFFCPALKLAVEVDGDSHFTDDVVEYDRNRQGYIESFGIRFLRFTNNEVYGNFESVYEFIYRTIELMSQSKLSDEKNEKPR